MAVVGLFLVVEQSSRVLATDPPPTDQIPSMPRRLSQCVSCRETFIIRSTDDTECIHCRGNAVCAALTEQQPVVDPLLPTSINSTVDIRGVTKKRPASPNDKARAPFKCLVVEDLSLQEGCDMARDLVVASQQQRLDRQQCHEGNDDDGQRDEIIYDLCDDDEHNDDQPFSALAEKLHLSLHRTQEGATDAPSSAVSHAKVAQGNDHDCDDSSVQEVPASPDPKGNRDQSICFICGASLLHIKHLPGRLNHMKRCGKKSGLSAKDIRWNDDHEMFVQSNSTSSPSKPSNPYAKPDKTWMVSTSSSGAASGAPQSESSANASRPALHEVLMAGARRCAQLKQIQEKAASAPVRRTTGKQPWWQRNQQRPKGTCPAYKKISGTDFCVDGFYYAAETKTFFLTHFHSDHYGGITSSWDSGTIYCSEVTASLLHQQLGVDRQYVHPLPMQTPVLVTSQGRAVTVTLLDANHCPGAVMFLFQVGHRHILHVGDFRWNRTIMEAQSPLSPFISGKVTLDMLYLDTTYCDAKYSLPTQDDAIQAAIEVAVREFDHARRTGKRLLMLFGAYTIGKERIYMAVARQLGVKVYVDPRRLRILSQLVWSRSQMELLTSKPNETNLWVVPLGNINMQKMLPYLQSQNNRKAFDRVVGFRPTGWSHSSKGTSIITTTTRNNLTVHGVPYSEHSSFPELLDCLKCLKPKQIIPTVSVSKSRQQVELLLSHL